MRRTAIPGCTVGLARTFLALTLGLIAACANPRWQPVGPAPQLTNGVGISGRVDFIASSADWDGNCHSALYLGAQTGGLWRSTDYLAPDPHWTPISDTIALPLRVRVGKLEPHSLTVNPFRPQEIYTTTAQSHGILVSADGGNQWGLVGQSYFADKTSIERIVVDRTDATGNTWFAVTLPAVANASQILTTPTIHRTSNAGQDWEGRSNGLPVHNNIDDLDAVLRSDGGLRLYAGVESSGIWYSDDSGASWTSMPIELVDVSSGSTLPATSIGLVRLAIDGRQGSPAGAYAALNNVDLDADPLLNVFHLVGDTWRPSGRNLPPNVSTQNGENLAFSLSPEGVLYLGTEKTSGGTFRSSDQGATWVGIGDGSNNITPHVDFHVWGFASGAVFAGNDGGIWRYLPSPNATDTGQWMSLNTSGLQTIQSNGVSADPADRNVMLEGSQDNSVARRNGTTWNYVFGGDAGPPRFETDPIQGSQYAYNIGPPEGGQTYFFASQGGGDANTWYPTRPDDFNVPSLPDYARFAMHPSEPGRLLLGLDRVFELTGRSTWHPLSPALEGTNLIAALTYGLTPGTVMVGYRNGHIWMTTDGGGDGEDPSHWTRIDQDVARGRPVSLLTDYLFSQVFFLLTSNGQIWRVTAVGGSAIWENVTGAFPADVMGLEIYSGARPSLFSKARGALFIGTSLGVFVSRYQSSSTCWEPYLSGMPDVPVTDLQEHVATDSLLAATYGRGIYVAPLREVAEPSLKLTYNAFQGCSPTTVTGGDVTISAETTALDGSKIDWSADSGTLSPAADGGSAVLSLPSTPQQIHVTATAHGDACAVSQSITLVVYSEDQANHIALICGSLRDRTLPNRIYDPLWDPLRGDPVPASSRPIDLAPEWQN